MRWRIRVPRRRTLTFRLWSLESPQVGRRRRHGFRGLGQGRHDLLLGTLSGLDEQEVGDLDFLAVLLEDEVRCLQAGHRAALPVGDVDLDVDHLDLEGLEVGRGRVLGTQALDGEGGQQGAGQDHGVARGVVQRHSALHPISTRPGRDSDLLFGSKIASIRCQLPETSRAHRHDAARIRSRPGM